MSAATGEISADIAWEWANTPALPGVALCQGYSGSARPSAEWIRSIGVPFLLGFESSTTRAYAGSPYGADDAAWHRTRAQEIGYPDDCGLWICAADTPNTPAAYWPLISAYFADWRRAYPSNVIVPYGNADAVRAAVAGAGGPCIEWGVGTWGYGEGGGANMPPAESSAGLVQSGNTPGPVPGSDLNWLYRPVSEFAAFGGPAAPAELEEKSTMLIGLRKTAGAAYDASIVDGGVTVHKFTGPYVQWGYVLTQQDAQEFAAASGTHPFAFTAAEWAAIDARTAASVGEVPAAATVDLSEIRSAFSSLSAALSRLP